jgi:hypothetical protein
MLYISDVYVVCHEYSDVPWRGQLFTNPQEALHATRNHHGFQLYACKLSDFIWQVREGKPTPRRLKDDGTIQGDGAPF